MLDEDEDIQTDGGLVVVSATRKELTIHWLAVGRRAEGLGLGSMLLKTVFEIAEVSLIRRVSTVIAPAYYGDPFYSGAEIFFEERFY